MSTDVAGERNSYKFLEIAFRATRTCVQWSREEIFGQAYEIKGS